MPDTTIKIGVTETNTVALIFSQDDIELNKFEFSPEMALRVGAEMMQASGQAKARWKMAFDRANEPKVTLT